LVDVEAPIKNMLGQTGSTPNYSQLIEDLNHHVSSVIAHTVKPALSPRFKKSDLQPEMFDVRLSRQFETNT
jgi:hypothetical protein